MYLQAISGIPVCSDHIKVGDSGGRVRDHSRLRNSHAPVLKQHLGICGALDHVTHGLTQLLAVKTGLEEIGVCSRLHRQIGGLFVLRFNQDQDRNVGCRARQTVKCVYSSTVGQIEVHQYRHDAVQAFKSFGAMSDPFNFEAFVVGMIQRA